MDVTQTEKIPAPPGIINSIKAGFDTVANHITAIFLPLLLNLFLWLGPRLRVDELFNSIRDDVILVWKSSNVPAGDIQQVLNWYDATIPSINLFWLFRTIPIGISSLLLPQNISHTPLGVPLVLQANPVSLLGWIFLITLVGWVGGGLYFRSVAWLASASDGSEPVDTSRAIVQTMLVSVFWGIFSAMILVPLFLILGLLLQFSAFIANIFVLILSLISMWVVVPLFFWPHGIFIKRQNFFTSILSSVQMARFTLPSSSMFVLTVFLLAFGLNFLWSIPPQDSWMTLLGIFGHSFVTTALLAGSFIYYRDMNIWLQGMIEKLRSTALAK